MLSIPSILSAVTVEPVYLFFSLSFGLYVIVSQELLISKVCKVNLQYPEEICDSIQQHEEEQIAVQKYTSTITMIMWILNAVPGVVFALFSGTWSDKHGRKLLLLITQFGVLLGTSVYLINSYYFYELRAEFLLLACVQDFFGGFVVFFMSANAYLADITEPEKRTTRMAFLSGLWPIGFNVGKALGGVIKTQFGFLYNMATALLVTSIGFAYTLIFLKESLHVRKAKLRQHEHEHEDEEEDEITFRTKVTSLFNLKNITTGFKVLLKKREHNMRMYLLLMAFCFEIEHFINVGDWSYQYLYLRKKIQIDLESFTRFTITMGILGVFAQYTIIPVLSQLAKLQDATIILINISGCIVRSLVFAFATTEWNIYVGGAVAFLDATSYSMLRCMVSKCVSHDEVGKIYAILGALQGFMPILSSPFFGLIYRNTVETLPSTFILVQTFFYIVDWIVLVILYFGISKVRHLLPSQNDTIGGLKEVLRKSTEQIFVPID